MGQSTGELKLGQFAGCETKGKVFSGGSSEVFDTLLGAKNKVCLIFVLYFGLLLT